MGLLPTATSISGVSANLGTQILPNLGLGLTGQLLSSLDRSRAEGHLEEWLERSVHWVLGSDIAPGMMWLPDKGSYWSLGYLGGGGKVRGWGEKDETMARNEPQGKVCPRPKEPARLNRKLGFHCPHPRLCSPPTPGGPLHSPPWIWAGLGGCRRSRGRQERWQNLPHRHFSSAISQCGMATSFILPMSSEGWNYCYAHFTAVETGSQSCWVT